MKAKGFLAVSAVLAALAANANTSWHWLAKKSVKDLTGSGYGYARNCADNWQNVETGESGIPAAGDIVIINSTTRPFGSDFDTKTAYGGLIYDSPPSGNTSDQGTFTLQAGGMGIVANVALTGETHKFNGNVCFTGSGEAVVDLKAGGTLFIQKSFYGNENITLVKRGSGTLQNSEGYAPLNTAKTAYTQARNDFDNYYANRKFVWKGVKLQAGRLDMRQYYWVRDCDFQFDGDGAVLDIKKLQADIDNIHSLELQNCKLRETENVTGTSHCVWGQSAACYIHMFGMLEDSSFSGEFRECAGLMWTPDNDAEFVFRKSVSPTKGILCVSNGTIRVTEGAGFPNVSSVTVSGANAKFRVDASAAQSYPSAAFTIDRGGKIALSAGQRVWVKSVTVGGEPVAAGVYCGMSGVAFGRPVDWIDGAAYVVVGAPEGEAVDATWNGTGNAGDLANWNGAEALPELGDGSAVVTVAGGSSFVADRDVWVKGFALGKSAFTLSAAAGKELWIGSRSVANASKVALTVDGSAEGAVVVVAAPQTWTMNTGLLTVKGTLKSVGDSELSIYHNAKSPTWADGAVVDANILVCDTSKASSGSTTITVPANGNLEFNGYFVTTNTGNLNITANAGSTVTFNKLFMSRNSSALKGSGRIVFKGPAHFRDRPGMSETVTVELHSSGNRLNGNMGTFAGGTLKAMAPYVITKANTRRFTTDKVANNSTDGAQNTMINAKDAFVLDLNGFDQSIDQIAMHADGNSSGGHVTSATPATLHLQTDAAYWAQHNYNYGFGSGYKTLSTADSYGFETSDKGYWEGAVNLSYEAAAGKVRSMMRTSPSTGGVEVVSGTLVFLRRAKTANETFDLKGGSANPYWRLANEDGAWPNASKAAVRGGVLKLEHGKAFSKATAFELDKAGKLDLDAGVCQRCASLTLDGVKVPDGIYGSSASGAENANDDYFTGKGVLKVGDFGLSIIVR